MNRVQYRRWKDFAIRMSQKGWCIREIMRKEHQNTVIPAVAHFFELMKWSYKDDIIRIESWDDTRTDTSHGQDCYGHYPIGPYICDIVSEHLNGYNPFYFYYEDEEFDKAYEDFNERWCNRVRCCIRASLDLAVEPSGGVFGFTKSDFERMYPKGVPKWIQNSWSKRNAHWKPVEWDDIPEEAKLWT